MHLFSSWNGTTIIMCYDPLMAVYIGFLHLLQVMDGLSTTLHSSTLLLLMESFQTQP